MVQEEWSHYGFDSLELVNYTVLLSYPNASQPNTLTLRTVDGGLIYNSHIQQEQPLTPGEDSPYVVPPFNAYSGTGTVKVRILLTASSCHFVCAGPPPLCQLWNFG